MSIAADENKHVSLSINEIDQLCPVAKALSSPMRARMIELLSIRPMNVNELAEALSLPVSTAALNVRQLEETGLITAEIQPGIRGAMKLCSRRVDSVSMRLTPEMKDGISAQTMQLPIGSYSAADSITSECGIVSDHACIGEANAPRAFYHPDRFQAQLLWFRSGELEYRFSLGEIKPSQVAFLEFSMEMFSSAPMHREDFRSDIQVAVNGVPLGVWTTPSDYSRRRGRLTPSWWSDTASQLGMLKIWHVDAGHTLLDGAEISAATLDDLHLDTADYISLRVGVPASGEHVGGLSLFGEKFGDFAQGVVMRVGYVK